MGELELVEVADRAGVAPAEVARLVELGILVSGKHGRFAPGDVRRARLMQTLGRAGIPVEDVAGAMRRGQLTLDFLDRASYERFASLTPTTFRELGERTGVPFEILRVVREAIGYAEPELDDRVREDELQIVDLIEIQVRAGFRHSSIERWLRVYGESMGRIAETEGEWWQSEVERLLLESGMSPAEVMEASDRGIGDEIAPLTDQVILALYHGKEEQAWTKNIIDGVEAALTQAGVYSRLERPPAICFLDITGYTRLTEERGDEAAAELADRLGRLVRRVALPHGGKPVKWLGDGVMFYFREPGPGVAAALEMVDGSGRPASLPPTSGCTRARCCSRRATTSGGPSTWRPGSRSTPGPARCWSAGRSWTPRTSRASRSPRSGRST